MGVYAPTLLLENAPPVQPVRFGLLSVATVVDSPDPHALNGIRFKSLACAANLAEFEAVCPPSANPVKLSTDDDRVTIETDGAFELYVNLSCRTTTLQEMFNEAREIYNLGESRALEAKVWEEILAVPTSVILNTVAGPAGALSLTAGISALESYMADCYPGRPTFHSDRGTVPYANADWQLQRTGSQLETMLGSSWAAYSGSPNTGPDGTVAPAGHAWLYASSQVTIYRWPLEVRPDGVGYVLKTGTNEPQVIAERSYLAFTECCTAAVLVCLGSCE